MLYKSMAMSGLIAQSGDWDRNKNQSLGEL